ncbi:uncharacterized protein PHALS_13803 [Plasmopara halstedii]|uniref:Uncharacterized protein n=1 Tax=Plasmopara halstedii TaxID=4781 RepID=A0A0P1AQJ4_PLAHL|nr:uncharacterized protein PHALS_13803 [Plasmopara halstedii]CEG43612.1 hypothetical protein PHALS_13803 [Plasmopara halstedii]|eukprot:XP_024579981.1 hypothetical protein PHALS_13803 [Plasmopara halstedii]
MRRGVVAFVAIKEILVAPLIRPFRVDISLEKYMLDWLNVVAGAISHRLDYGDDTNR